MREDPIMDKVDHGHKDAAIDIDRVAALERTLAGVPVLPNLGVFARDCAANITLFNDWALTLF